MGTPPPDDLAAAARRAAAIYTAFLRDLGSRRVAPAVTRAELRERLLGTIGNHGVGLDAALDDFERDVLPHSMTTPHPLYLGLINCSPLPAAPLGDLLVSALNNNGGAYHQSPAITTAEEEVRRAFREVLGLGEEFSGMLLPGGTFANLQGLVLARAAAFPTARRTGIPHGGPALIYTGASSHFSVARAAQVMGIGEDHVIAVPTVGRGEVDVAALRRRVATDRAAGSRPFAVVANVGSTGTGALDPIAAIADVCAAERLWLHVDACYGGGAALLDELRGRLAGIERADSIAVDPHKWFFAPIASGLLLTRHADVEHAAFAIDASYIPHDEGDAFLRGIPTSRRSSGLTIWLALRAHGWDTVRDAVRRNVAQSRLLERLLAERGFEVLPGGELSIACARWTNSDALQRRIAESVVASGKAWFGTVRHGGHTWLRFNVVNLHTRDHHIEQLAEILTETARRLEEPA